MLDRTILAGPVAPHEQAQGSEDRGFIERGDGEYLRKRLQHLLTVVPVFAQELVSARRQAAQLLVENGRLRAQVGQLEPAGRSDTDLINS